MHGDYAGARGRIVAFHTPLRFLCSVSSPSFARSSQKRCVMLRSASILPPLLQRAYVPSRGSACRFVPLAFFLNEDFLHSSPNMSFTPRRLTGSVTVLPL